MTKIKDTIYSKQFVSKSPLKPLKRISWNVVVMKIIICRYAFSQEPLIWSFLRSNLYPLWTLAKIILCISDETGFLSDCPSLMPGIAIRCIQHSQAMLGRGVWELAHSFFHFLSVCLSVQVFIHNLFRITELSSTLLYIKHSGWR